MDKKPFDLTGLAITLGIAYATVYRRANELAQHGLIELKREGRRVLVSSHGDWLDDDFQRIADVHIRTQLNDE